MFNRIRENMKKIREKLIQVEKELTDKLDLLVQENSVWHPLTPNPETWY
jgi:hypothetical protein